MHICHFSGSCPGSHYAKPRISTPTSTFPLAEIFPSDHFSPGFSFVNATDSNSGVLCWLFQWLWKSHKSLQCHAELGLMPLIVYLFIRSGLPGCSLLLWPLSSHATILQPMSDELHWKMINWEKELFNFFLFFLASGCCLACKCNDGQGCRMHSTTDPRCNPFFKSQI